MIRKVPVLLSIIMLLIISCSNTGALPSTTYKGYQSTLVWTGDVDSYLSSLEDRGITSYLQSNYDITNPIYRYRFHNQKEITTTIKDEWEDLISFEIKTETPDTEGYCEYTYTFLFDDGIEIGYKFIYQENTVIIQKKEIGSYWNTINEYFSVSGILKHSLVIEESNQNTLKVYLADGFVDSINYVGFDISDNIDFTLSTKYQNPTNSDDYDKWSLSIVFKDTPHITTSNYTYLVSPSSVLQIPFSVNYEGYDNDGGFIGFQAISKETLSPVSVGNADEGLLTVKVGKLLNGQNQKIVQPFETINNDFYLGTVKYKVFGNLEDFHKFKILTGNPETGTEIYSKTFRSNGLIIADYINYQIDDGEQIYFIWEMVETSKSMDLFKINEDLFYPDYKIIKNDILSTQIGNILCMAIQPTLKTTTITNLDNNNDDISGSLSENSFSGFVDPSGKDVVFTLTIGNISKNTIITVELSLYDNQGRFISGILISDDGIENIENGNNTEVISPLLVPLGITANVIVLLIIIIVIMMIVVRKLRRNKNGNYK